MKKIFKHNFLEYFLFYYRVLGVSLLFNLLISALASFLDGVGLAMFIPLLQGLNSEGNLKSRQSHGHFVSFFEMLNLPLNLYTILVFLVIVFVLKGFVKFWQLNSQVNLRQLFIKRIRYELTENLQELSFKGFLKLDAGYILNTMNAEVGKLQTAMASYLTSISGVVMLLTYVIMAFLTNWEFAILVAVGAILSNSIFKRIFTAVKIASVNVSKQGNVFNSQLIQAVHYFKYLKATNYFEKFSKKLRQVIDDTEKLNKSIGFHQSITASVREPLVLLIVVIVIVVQVKWMGGSIASIIFSLLLFYRALSALITLQTSWQLFIQNVGAINSVSDLTEEMKEMREMKNNNVFLGMKHAITIRNASFSYGDVKVLNKINIDILKNTTVAFVGESGSGKTTLANLIVGLISPNEGVLAIDEVSLEDYNIDNYRSLIGYISQEMVVFNDDIFNNITFWAERNKENEERFWKVITLTSLNSFVQNQPQKELTKLGDNGISISGGQKQRISIARELYKRAEVLIFDEATSALDSETERIIQENIEKLHGSYTMIIIAHRLSTIKNVDTIYLMENGVVKESGNFSAMMKSSERFRRMVELQEVKL